MTTNNSTQLKERGGSGKAVTGVMLVIIGLIALAVQYVEVSGSIFLGGLALIFLAWGLLTRSFGLIIPGGILAGIALGVYLTEGPFAAAQDITEGAIFLLAFSAGWALISLLSLFTNGRAGWEAWPLIPGGIMGVVAGAMLSGESGLRILNIIGQGWPVILIAIGLYLVLWRRDRVK